MIDFPYKLKQYLRYLRYCDEKNLSKYSKIMCFYETYKTGVYKNICREGCKQLEECKVQVSVMYLR